MRMMPGNRYHAAMRPQGAASGLVDGIRHLLDAYFQKKDNDAGRDEKDADRAWRERMATGNAKPTDPIAQKKARAELYAMLYPEGNAPDRKDYLTPDGQQLRQADYDRARRDFLFNQLRNREGREAWTRGDMDSLMSPEDWRNKNQPPPNPGAGSPTGRKMAGAFAGEAANAGRIALDNSFQGRLLKIMDRMGILPSGAMDRFGGAAPAPTGAPPPAGPQGGGLMGGVSDLIGQAKDALARQPGPQAAAPPAQPQPSDFERELDELARQVATNPNQRAMPAAPQQGGGALAGMPWAPDLGQALTGANRDTPEGQANLRDYEINAEGPQKAAQALGFNYMDLMPEMRAKMDRWGAMLVRAKGGDPEAVAAIREEMNGPDAAFIRPLISAFNRG